MKYQVVLSAIIAFQALVAAKPTLVPSNESIGIRLEPQARVSNTPREAAHRYNRRSINKVTSARGTTVDKTSRSWKISVNPYKEDMEAASDAEILGEVGGPPNGRKGQLLEQC
jgi:hypothetical protein